MIVLERLEFLVVVDLKEVFSKETRQLLVS